MDIVAKHRHFIVVSKPVNVNFHDEGMTGQGFFSQVKKNVQKQYNIQTLFPVHRLDKMTSGLMIFAFDLSTAQQFQRMFEQHEISKYYIAIAQGKPKKKQGLIKGDMAKSRRGMWKLLRSQQSPAITQFLSFNIATKTRLYLLRPYSGKTHQIRVALNSLGVPILGDPLYGGASNAERGYLHAFALSFTLAEQRYQYVLPPIEGEEFLTENCQKTIATLAPPWSIDWPTL